MSPITLATKHPTTTIGKLLTLKHVFQLAALFVDFKMLSILRGLTFYQKYAPT